MDRRQALELLGGFIAVAAGCTASEEVRFAEAVKTYNDGIRLIEDAERALESADDSYERSEWRDAEDEYNWARSAYRRAASRFSETRREGSECDHLVDHAAESYGHVTNMERACRAWMRAAAARRNGRRSEAESLRGEGDRLAEQARGYERGEAVDPEAFEC